LIDDEAWAEYERKQARCSALSRFLAAGKVSPEGLAAAGLGELPATAGLTWAQLLKRPEAGIEAVLPALRVELERDPLLADFAALTGLYPDQNAKAGTAGARNEARAVETEIKFAGYLEQQKKSIAKLKAAESVAIPEWIDYGAISGLSREMREKLERVRPATIGQASRISGVTPAALGLVHVSIRLQGARRAAV
jgi:tRNA uridine 5-carboxymethylaminomethyl modification enzyme